MPTFATVTSFAFNLTEEKLLSPCIQLAYQTSLCYSCAGESMSTAHAPAVSDMYLTAWCLGLV